MACTIIVGGHIQTEKSDKTCNATNILRELDGNLTKNDNLISALAEGLVRTINI